MAHAKSLKNISPVSKRRPTVIDLFAGAGLFSFAFQREGFDTVLAVELERVAAATHARNLGPHVVVADVRAVECKLKADVLIAGPPCQGFSTLGKRNADDPRNSLCLEVARWAQKSKPSVIVVENVAAFLESKFSNRLINRLTRMGYVVERGVLNSVNFGVPQIRLRSFIIASRIGRICLPEPTVVRPKTVRDALAGLPTIPDGHNHHVARIPTKLALDRIRVIPPGGDKRDIMRLAPSLAPPSWWRTETEVTDVWGRIAWNAPCNTLRTEFLNPSKGRYLHPIHPRVITVREAARLHTIPDSWSFEGKPWQIARQIGNSVPPKLGRAVAKQVFQALIGAK